MPVKADQYTENQLAACRRFVEGMSRTEAWKGVYSSGHSKPANIRSRACEFFRQPKIQALVEQLQAESIKRMNVTQDRVTREVVAVAFASLPDLIETDADDMLCLKRLETLTDAQRRAVKKLKMKKRTTTDEDGGRTVVLETEIELHGKLEALEMLGRNLGMFSQRVIFDIPRLDYQPGTAPADSQVEHIPAGPVIVALPPARGGVRT